MKKLKLLLSRALFFAHTVTPAFQYLFTLFSVLSNFTNNLFSFFYYSLLHDESLHSAVDAHTAFSIMFISCCKKYKKTGIGGGISSLGRFIFFWAAVVTEDFVSSAARLRRRTNTTSRTPEHSGCLPARTCCQTATQPASQSKKKGETEA